MIESLIPVLIQGNTCAGCVPRATHPAHLSPLTAKPKCSNDQSACHLRQRPRGFTLIELLVVLVVMGVALGLVTVQLMPDHQAALREEAARLALLLENAGLEARASGRSLAWSGEKNKYRFFSRNEYGDWVRIDDDSSFRPRTLPDGVNVGELSVEEQVLKPGEYILLSAHSFAVPFIVRLSSEYGAASVTGKSTGEVVFSLDNPQAGNSAP